MSPDPPVSRYRRPIFLGSALLILAGCTQPITPPAPTPSPGATAAPSDPAQAALAQAASRIASGDPVAAERAYRALLQHWPQNPDGWEGLAAALYHQRRFFESERAARRAVALEPTAPKHRAVMAVSLMERVLQYPNKGAFNAELREARRELDALLPTWSQKGEVLYRLGRIAIVQRDYAAAVRYLQQAQDLLPERAAIPFTLASAYIGQDNRAQGRQVVVEGLKRFPEEAALHDLLGQILQRSGEPGSDQRALAAFSEAVRLAPDVGRFQERYGSACLRSSRLAEARAAFEKATRYSPNRAFGYQQLALIYNRLGDPKRARAAARIAAEVVADENQLKQVQNLSAVRPDNVELQLILADRYRDLGMVGPARDTYLDILKRAPGNARARAGLRRLRASS